MAAPWFIRLTAIWRGELSHVAEDFLKDPQVRGWLDGVEPAWTLLTFESLRALRQEPSTVQTAIRIADDLVSTRSNQSSDEPMPMYAYCGQEC